MLVNESVVSECVWKNFPTHMNVILFSWVTETNNLLKGSMYFNLIILFFYCHSCSLSHGGSSIFEATLAMSLLCFFFFCLHFLLILIMSSLRDICYILFLRLIFVIIFCQKTFYMSEDTCNITKLYITVSYLFI